MSALKWSPPVKQQLVDELTRRGAVKPCPRCGARAFTLLEGFGSLNLQPNVVAAGAFGGPSVPMVIVLCTNCGFVSPHAVGILVPAPGGSEQEP